MSYSWRPCRLWQMPHITRAPARSSGLSLGTTQCSPLYAAIASAEPAPASSSVSGALSAMILILAFSTCSASSAHTPSVQ